MAKNNLFLKFVKKMISLERFIPTFPFTVTVDPYNNILFLLLNVTNEFKISMLHTKNVIK